MIIWPKCLHCKEWLDAGDAKKHSGFCCLEHRNLWRAAKGLKPYEPNIQ